MLLDIDIDCTMFAGLDRRNGPLLNVNWNQQ